MQLTLRQLGYFVAVVDAANMSRAAAGLNVAPTAISLQVKAMEEALKVRLLDRHSRGVRPTSLGRALYERARLILDLAEETERTIRAAKPLTGRTLRLGMPPAVARTIGVEALLGAARSFTGVTVQISEGWSSDLIERVSAGELDFVIGYDVRQPDAATAFDILEERFVLTGTAAMIGTGKRISLDRALEHDLAFYGDRGVAWKATQEAATLSGQTDVRKRDVESIDVWRTMLCRGLAAAIAPFGAIAEECRRGELVARVIDRPPIIRRLGLSGSSEAFAFGRAIGLVEFLEELVVSAHVASGPYYRILTAERGSRTPAASG